MLIDGEDSASILPRAGPCGKMDGPTSAISAGEQLRRIVRSGRVVSMAGSPSEQSARIEGPDLPGAAGARDEGCMSQAISVIGRCTR
jgi:hypothetical protein